MSGFSHHSIKDTLQEAYSLYLKKTALAHSIPAHRASTCETSNLLPNALVRFDVKAGACVYPDAYAVSHDEGPGLV